VKKILTAALILLLFACSNQSDNANTQQTDMDRALAQLEKEGFDMSKITPDGDAVIVDGDARLSLETILSSEGRDKQYATRYSMTQSNASNIRIRITSGVPSAWVTATRQAIANWNASGSNVQMTEVSSGENMTIYYQNLGNPQAIAQAEFPSSSGQVGYRVRINTNFASLSASRKEFTMTHEIGHCIGFRHTNWFDRNSNGVSGDVQGDREPDTGIYVLSHIAGTPTGLDGSSVMNAIVANWNGFGQYDLVAVRALYPSGTTPPPTGGGITGPQNPAAGQSATFTSPAGSSYQWWYNLGSSWVKWNGVTSRSVTFSYTGTLSLAVVVNNQDVYYKRDITF
jgi:hypothetical protein